MNHDGPTFTEGSTFDNLEQLKQVYQMYAIENHFKFHISRSTKTRYQIACKVSHCSWYLYATTVNNTANIKIGDKNIAPPLKFPHNYTQKCIL